MEIHQTGIYHIYNRGNNKQQIFFNRENYSYFLKKCHHFIKPVCEILAWCFMPNHFHFLIEVNEKSLAPVKVGGILMPVVTNGFRLLQSSYAKGINKQESRTGNLFQQKTKAKLINPSDNYSTTAFFYIHQNSVASALVKHAKDWQFSSFNEFASMNSNSLSNLARAMELLGLSSRDIQINAVNKLDPETIKGIF